MKIIITKSFEETEKIGAKIAEKISFPSIFTLYGDLGCGKTTFSRGFARGLGLTEPVTSPTFNLVVEYPLTQGIFYHMDIYRLGNLNGSEDIFLDEYLAREDAVSLIEWPERIEAYLPQNVIKIQFSHISENERKIELPEGLLDD